MKIRVEKNGELFAYMSMIQVGRYITYTYRCQTKTLESPFGGLEAAKSIEEALEILENKGFKVNVNN